jgi:hypothetical protein
VDSYGEPVFDEGFQHRDHTRGPAAFHVEHQIAFRLGDDVEAIGVDPRWTADDLRGIQRRPGGIRDPNQRVEPEAGHPQAAAGLKRHGFRRVA